MRVDRCAILAALALSSSGCAHLFGGGFHFGAAFAHAPAALGHIAVAPAHAAIATAPAVGAAIVAARGAPEILAPAFVPPAIVAPVTPPQPDPPPLDAPESPGPAPLGSFDPVSARSSLARADLGACRSLGLPRGYVHARVAFDPSGRVTRVELDAPGGLSRAAVTCAGESLAAARARPFSGGAEVVVGVTAFVP